MTTLQKLNHAIEMASSIGPNSDWEELETAEDYAYMISIHADKLEEHLLNEIDAVMEVRKHG